MRSAAFYASVVGDELRDPAAATLLELLPDLQGLRVLDLACGQGRLSRELARRGARVVGLDISTELLDKASSVKNAEPLRIATCKQMRPHPKHSRARASMASPATSGCQTSTTSAQPSTVSRVLTQDGWFVFSILHPCFPGWGDDAPSSWPPGRGYFAEGWWLADNPGFRGKEGRSKPPHALDLPEPAHRARACNRAGCRAATRWRVAEREAERRPSAGVFRLAVSPRALRPLPTPGQVLICARRPGLSTVDRRRVKPKVRTIEAAKRRLRPTRRSFRLTVQ